MSETDVPGKDAPVPNPKKVPHVTNVHGVDLVDDYFWMRDKDDPDLMPHLEAENLYADAFMADTTELQADLFKEMRGRIKEEDQAVPNRRGRFEYYSRTEEGKQYSVFCRKRLKKGSTEEVLLDMNELAEGHEFFSVGALVLSPSQNFLAYSVDTTGYRQYTLMVKNLRTGKTINTGVERLTSVVWARDNKTLFYSTEDEVTKRSNKVFRYKLGQKTHHFLFELKDELYTVHVSKGKSGKFIYLYCGGHVTNWVSYISADEPKAEFKPLTPKKENVRYSINDDGENFYILTNKDGATDYKVMKVSVKAPEVKNWKSFIRHKPGTLIQGIDVFKNFIVVSEQSGLSKIRVIDVASGDSHYIEFPEVTYVAGTGANFEFDTEVLRLSYQSPKSPATTYDYHMGNRTLETLKVQEVIGYDASQYHCERIYATAEDGTKVPMSLVYKGELKGPRPSHIYGYGSYGHAIPPYFSSARLSLLDRGFVYAICHIRGGDDCGEQWREDGKMMKKMNTFTDFIACGDHLVKAGYTTHDQMTMSGGSAGGLLMGAVLNLRPKGFVIAAHLAVPFVDVLNTMLDETLPLTVGEYVEWGNPNIKAEFDYIRSYSPYDNIAATDYCAMLLTSSLNDSQVGYHEPAKYAAKMRELNTSDEPIIFKIILGGGGHGGKSGRFDALEEVAFEYAFMLKMVELA